MVTSTHTKIYKNKKKVKKYILEFINCLFKKEWVVFCIWNYQ